MTFPITKRIYTELFIDERAALDIYMLQYIAWVAADTVTTL